MADTRRTVHLHRLVNDIANLLRHFGFDHRHPDARLFIAQNIHRFGRFQNQQTHRFNLDLRARNRLHVLAQINDLFAKRDTVQTAIDHQIQRLFRLPDRTHAVVNTTRSKTHLRNFKTLAFAPKNAVFRHAHIGESNVHMAVRCIVMTKHMHGSKDFNTGVIHRHKDLGLLAERFGIRRSFDHHDHHLTARITRARDVVFFAVQHPFAVFQHSHHTDILRIRRSAIRFGHRKRRTDFTREQRLEPFVFLLLRADTFQHFHVACVRRGTIQSLGRERVFPKLCGDVGVVQVRQPFARLRVGQEEVPKARITRLLLGGFHQFHLTRRVRPAVLAPFASFEIFLGHRVHILANVLHHSVQKRLGLVGHFKVVQARWIFAIGHLRCLLFVDPFGRTFLDEGVNTFFKIFCFGQISEHFA